MSFILKIDQKEYSFKPGETVLQTARRHGLFIPALCYHPDFPKKGNCRLCLVEFIKDGRRQINSACSIPSENGLDIFLDTVRIKRLRRTNLELLFAEHVEKCPTCELKLNCPLLNLVKKYRVKISRFPERKADRQIVKFGPAISLDNSKCIDCKLCLDACNTMQKLHCLQMAGQGAEQEIKETKNVCTYCGQCVTHCPVAAFQEQPEHSEVTQLLKENKKIIVAQFAPSIRAAIGEEFGAPYDDKMAGRISAALKKLGFNYVFDVNLGADITTITEADELIERLNDKKAVFPMMTSCCPAWVRYVETRHPELIPNLTTSRSPHMHLGGMIKTYWADKNNINPEDICVVSVMPCTAKKYEVTRPEFKIKGLDPVDHVITTRELAQMIKEAKIDFINLKPQASDLVWNNGSGAGAIYGVSGGVMESALRTAVWHLEKRKDLAKLEFCEVRGLAGVKEASVEVAGRTLRVAVVNGLGNINNILGRLNDFDYVEVMSCPGGCIGGGGQPFPVSNEIRLERIKSLYSIDSKQELRRAHENMEALAGIDYVKKAGLGQAVLNTTFKAKK